MAAALEYDCKEIGIAGGVAANSGLRTKFGELAKQFDWNLYFPAMQYCTDNAGMIAIAAHFQYLAGNFSSLDTAPFVRGME